MRRSLIIASGALYALLSACQFATPRASPMLGPVYDHVACDTPGALREQSIDSAPAAASRSPDNAKSERAGKTDDRCVIERR